ncbi:hypothetical protein [Mesoflavibacter sp. SCSIO 43206]|uniref:hypothetical protein n=1 Tax=Mesoflavibacter sp. SCSIO 43206 TaxID=2779362 RepID=UPI001CA86E2D|nr:hypothetical protein [Mesoflavibacter sp. SCSIO 43206]UAB75584.1 hypothetical protein INR78_00940 [Mesoflavibacter sp. SCSIO 43206]
MILTASTNEKSTRSSSQKTLRTERSYLSHYLFNRLKQPIDDVIVIFESQPFQYDVDLSSEDLTNSSMILSQTSFSEEWDKEDDDYWNSYL